MVLAKCPIRDASEWTFLSIRGRMYKKSLWHKLSVIGKNSTDNL